MEGRLIWLALGTLLGSLSIACLFSMGRKRKIRDLPSADTEGSSIPQTGRQRKITDYFRSADMEGSSIPQRGKQRKNSEYCRSADMEGSSIPQRGKRRKITDYFRSADMEGCSNAQRRKQRKITDYFRSADMEGFSSTSFETFKHYEPSPVQNHKKYDVFLSFRGAIRNTFVDHLYNSLKTAGFHVFFDEERLEKGKEIKDRLEDAIRNSTVQIPIFCAHYASSSWCLDELSLMSACTETTVIPLFYNVEPSNVRYPDNGKSPYAKAFQEHRNKKRHSKEQINAWKKALHQVSLLSGWSLTETVAGKEGRLVKLIVTDLLTTLRIKDEYIAKHPVGLIERMEEVTRLLEMNDQSRHLLFAGFRGMGGLGKTTLARAVYNSFYPKFQASCFVSDVRDKDLLQLQKKILMELAKVDDSTLNLNSVANAKSEMKKRLGSVKALVILDNVDKEEQIEALVGDAFNGYWFGAGSRIIVTTRNSQVWERQTPVNEYSMTELDPKESLQLFCWHAFMRPDPPEEYKDIAKKIVEACRGVPLSLEIVGARLHNEKNFKIWWESLTYLTNLVENNEKVYDTLKISYNALSSEEKRMFLDIACFFLGPVSFPSTRYHMEFYVNLWEALGVRGPRICLRNLEMMSFISINYDRNRSGYSIFRMHDLLRDLGRQIIKESSPSNPVERSRFWCHKDLVTAMAQTQEMPKVEGLVLDFRQAGEGLHQTDCSTYPWESLPNLKFMFICSLCQKGRTKLPPNLIFLGLSRCQFQEDESVSETDSVSSCLPKTIGELESLRFLDMSGTSIYHLPKEVGELCNLEELYLSNCFLRELPQSLANLTKLKVLDIARNYDISFTANFHLPSSLIELHLQACSNMEKMPSMSDMKKLEVLDLSWCASLAKLPLLDSMHSLRDLKLHECELLRALPALPDTLRCLDLSGCRKLQKVSGISHLKKLEVLDLSWCTSLAELPLLDSMHSLRDLKLQECEVLQALPTLPDTFSCLDLSGCRKLQRVSRISHLKKLEVLDLSRCKSLSELPSLDSMISLTYLKLRGCEELQALSALPDTVTVLDLSGCHKLQEVSSISLLEKLKSLDLSGCTSLSELPSLDSIDSLTYLKLWDCQKLQTLSALPDNITVLDLSGCHKLQEVSNISHLKKLEALNVARCTSLTELPSLEFMHALKIITLHGCGLWKLPSLPESFSLAQNIDMDFFTYKGCRTFTKKLCDPKDQFKREEIYRGTQGMEGGSSISAEIFKHYEPSRVQHHRSYHVFLSFLGTDVRNTLVDHLVNSLSSAGFKVFLEIESLEKGKNTEVSLGDAIRNSTVHIPILSANYASSPWCLNELSLMWTCKSTCTGTTIIPLYYNVEPSYVRYPYKKGSYAKAFQELREKGRHSEKKMDAWKQALYQVSLLFGWSLAETASGYEGRLVKLVQMDLLRTLDVNSLYVAKHPVGLSDVTEEVTTLLRMDDRSVLCVGIWGMGGLGKTTLAKALYNNIHHQFEESCFVPDVRASVNESVKGLLKLQKLILRDVAKVDESTLKSINSVSSAKIQMESRLRFIKALVILDDVDDVEQLNVLVGDAINGYWFGAGSRIIVTTRDSQFLKRQPRVIKYSMRVLNRKESVKLFSWHAFMNAGPPEGYEDFTEEIVDACQGLPLSLEVVGAQLYSEMSPEIWREALIYLRGLDTSDIRDFFGRQRI